ncbi:uncharacterized protein EV154DRAFT_480495 [Mucor mucedo]|uniref:uncharacterized protein n=1 Tax=Mucor mucedo TaxID=29922 RepID=UPI00221F6E2B|nr:uncharacterized protein EV154DRAFT_480495 [Mucor mucedo]KAI7892321.1 hypothetical protein EV154DRAFT_480495 [Mucor mucedo]
MAQVFSVLSGYHSIKAIVFKLKRRLKSIPISFFRTSWGRKIGLLKGTKFLAIRLQNLEQEVVTPLQVKQALNLRRKVSFLVCHGSRQYSITYANYIKWRLYVFITTAAINAIGYKVYGRILYKIDLTQEALDICQTEAAKATNNIQKIAIDKVKLTVKTKRSFDDTVSRPNFLTTRNPEVKYFEYSPSYKWDFESYKKHMMDKRVKPKAGVIFAKYKHCLNLLARFDDLSANNKRILEGLLRKWETSFDEQQQQQHQQQQQQQQSISNVFNNYDGLQANSVSMSTSGERVIDECKVSDAESLNTPESCQAVEDSEPASFITDTSDESFQAIEPASDLGECLKLREYILELKEFGNPMPTNQVFIHSMDNALSLDERLRLSLIKYCDSCPAELSLKPKEFSDETYTEIRKRRRTNLLETLDRPPATVASKQSEFDYYMQTVSIILRFIFNSKSKIKIAWKMSYLNLKMIDFHLLFCLFFTFRETPSITNQTTLGKLVIHDFVLYSQY